MNASPAHLPWRGPYGQEGPVDGIARGPKKVLRGAGDLVSS